MADPVARTSDPFDDLLSDFDQDLAKRGKPRLDWAPPMRLGGPAISDARPEAATPDETSGSQWFDRLPRSNEARPMERESPWMPVEIDQGQRGRVVNPEPGAAGPYPNPVTGDPGFRQSAGARTPMAEEGPGYRYQPGQPLEVDVTRTLPRPDMPQVGGGEYGMPYMPPLAQERGQGGPEVRSREPSMQDRARQALIELGVPPEQAGRAASVVDPAIAVARTVAPPIPGVTAPSFEEGVERLREKAQQPVTEHLEDFAAQAAPVVAGAAIAPLARVGGPAIQRGMQAAGQAIREAPGRSGALIAGGAAVTGAGEAGDDPQSQASAADKQRDSDLVADARRQLDDASNRLNTLSGTAEQLRRDITKFASLPKSGEAVIVAQRELNALGYNAGKEDGNRDGPITRGALERYAADKKGQLKEIEDQIRATNAAIPELRRRTSPQFLEDMAKVREAESVRRQMLAEARRPFEDAYPDAARNWWLAPAVLGGLTALMIKAPGAISDRFQAGRWWKAVRDANNKKATPAARAEARILAEKFEKAMPKQEWDEIAKSYKLPVGVAAIEGFGVANIPEFHNLFLPAENPERKAYEEYIKRLPPNHPEIARTIEALKSMPEDNPARRSALQHFGYIYPMIVKGVEGAVEAGLGAAFGTTTTKVIAPRESGLPRPETEALLEAAAKRSKAPSQLQGQSTAPRALPSPGTAAPPSSGRQQSRTSPRESQGSNSKPETWQTPDGKVIKRGSGGKTWHDESGDFTSPPPKGSKRLSLYDRLKFWGGFA